jgi:LysR family glycine cleavage system transcriptional activator
MQAAMNDLGIALAPWCLLEDDIRADRLRPLFDGPQLPNAGIHALYRQDGPAAASALLFIEWLREQGRDPSHTA